MLLWVCHAWSRTLPTSRTVSVMNILTLSRGKPIIFTSVSEMCQLLLSDNCRVGLYCDSTQKVCIQRKNIGDQCDADKE